MKIPALAVALMAAVAFAAPAEAAAKKKRKSVPQQRAVATQADRYDVFDADRVVGRDPDPFIRAMIQRDPRPWESSD